jgi:hypothetical protein
MDLAADPHCPAGFLDCGLMANEHLRLTQPEDDLLAGECFSGHFPASFSSSFRTNHFSFHFLTAGEH